MKVKLSEKFLVHLIDEGDERFQARLDYDSKEIQRLANDIAQFGQRSPIGVRKSPEKKDEYQLIYGFQRFKAIKILGNETIKAYVYEEITNEECEEISISDNITHGDLTEIEKALKAKSLKDKGLKVEQLTEMFGVEKSSIYNWLKVASLDKITRACVHFNLITLYHGLELAKVDKISRRLEILTDIISWQYSVRDTRNRIAGKPVLIMVPLNGWIDICPKVMKMMPLNECEKCEHFAGYGKVIKEANEYRDKPLREVGCGFAHDTIPDEIRKFIKNPKGVIDSLVTTSEPEEPILLPKEVVIPTSTKKGLEKWTEE